MTRRANCLRPRSATTCATCGTARRCTTQQREVPLTAQQIKMMADLKRDLMVQVKGDTPITATNEAAARQKFIQISLGAIYDAAHDVHLIDAKPRLNELKELLEQAPGKCLILVPLTSIVNLLYRELKQTYSCEIVNGDTSPKERNRIFESFPTIGEQRSTLSYCRSRHDGSRARSLASSHCHLVRTLRINRGIPASQPASASSRPEIPGDGGAVGFEQTGA